MLSQRSCNTFETIKHILAQNERMSYYFDDHHDTLALIFNSSSELNDYLFFDNCKVRSVTGNIDTLNFVQPYGTKVTVSSVPGCVIGSAGNRGLSYAGVQSQITACAFNFNGDASGQSHFFGIA